MWIYAQATGHLFRQHDGTLDHVATGYSGRGRFLNQPDAQCHRDFGPLPRGEYSFSAPVTMHFMVDCLPLAPARSNDMCQPARSGFWVHDGIFNGPHGQSSHGCICLQRPVRQLMWASGDHALRVVAADPEDQGGTEAPRATAAAPVRVKAFAPIEGHDATPPESLNAAASQVTLFQGRRYRATVTLNWVEAFASNGTIVDILESAGFSAVTVTGAGTTRDAEGLWPKPNLAGTPDPRLSDIRIVD